MLMVGDPSLPQPLSLDPLKHILICSLGAWGLRCDINDIRDVTQSLSLGFCGSR